MMMNKQFFVYGILVMLFVGCTGRGQTPADLPTRIPSVDALATADMQTRNAPPVPFNNGVTFPMIDDNLPLLPNWRYDATLRFVGVFSNTSRSVEFEAGLQVFFNQLGNQRRTVISGVGELFGESDGAVLEGVRLGQRTFIVRQNTCQTDTQDPLAPVVADLRAGELLGGVTFATPGASKGVLNGEEVWRFDITADQLILPQVQFGELGRIIAMTGELWVAPNRNAVIRYYINLDVENVVITLFDSTLPLTGQLFLRYDLNGIGENPNITTPTGC
ncbi:MAG: hypothetical protein SH821_15505 [Phototrophicales bacterium]|nr:hypothetical protein [Phototrophicales bacterium]